jgi:hypothetical protein
MEAAARTLGVYILDPPYTMFRPSGSRLPALGAILLADVRLGRSTGESLGRTTASAPWCPTAAVVPANMPARQLMEILDLLPHGCVRLLMEPDANPLDPASCVLAIARRSEPTPSEIAGYVASRTGSGIASPLTVCFGRNDVEGSSRSSLSRSLRSYPPYTAHDWTAIGMLLRMLGSARWPSGRLAHDNGIDPRTLRAWTARYLALPWALAKQLLGWEWIVEAALRRGGYVPVPFAHSSADRSAVGG